MSGPGGFAGVALAALGEAPRQALALLEPGPAPQMLPSSPRLTTIGWMRRELGWSSRRRDLIDGFERRLGELRAAGVEPVCALVGGSVMGDKDSPGDLDALVVYRLDPLKPIAPEAAEALRRKEPGLDLRFVPADAEPVLLIKMSCFFHTLYQGLDKGLRQSSLLLALDFDPPEAAETTPSTRPS